MPHPHSASRRSGICRGTLWKQHVPVASPMNHQQYQNQQEPPQQQNAQQQQQQQQQQQAHDERSTLSSEDLSQSNRRARSHEYCVLIGDTLSSYPDIVSYYCGDFPSTEIKIVGASAWNHFKEKSSTAFRIVTYAGTHVYCTARTIADRDAWLAALHSGLEASYALSHGTVDEDEPDNDSSHNNNNNNSSNNGDGSDKDSLNESGRQRRAFRSMTSRELLVPPSPLPLSGGSSGLPSLGVSSSSHSSLVVCRSCGITDGTSTALSSSPLPQYGLECRAHLCGDCRCAQGLLGHVRQLSGLYASHAHERAALRSAHAAAARCVEVAFQEEAKRIVRRDEEDRQWERHARQRASTSTEPTPLERQLAAVETDDNDNDDTDNDNDNGNDNGTDDKEAGTSTSTSLGGSWTQIGDAGSGAGSGEDPAATDNEETPSKAPLNNNGSSSSNSSNNNATVPPTSTSPSTWLHLPPTDPGIKALSALVVTPGFATYRRRSRILETICRRLEKGAVDGSAEFLELLEDMSSMNSSSKQDPPNEDDPVRLKTQAFRVAGDMGAAVKLLVEHALPHQQRRTNANASFNHTNSSTNNPNNSYNYNSTQSSSSGHDMLATILEFLLDLCEEGQLKAIAFFWPQLCHIHLRMLPALDADAMVRVELFEDFLCTVCQRYSVHLALELVWGLKADLEQGMESDLIASLSGGSTDVSPNVNVHRSSTHYCRARRFAVLRFILELEALLLDAPTPDPANKAEGWGSISLGETMALRPSIHQLDLLVESMEVLQIHRQRTGRVLRRSVRLNMAVPLRVTVKAPVEEKEEFLLPPPSTTTTTTATMTTSMTTTTTAAATNDSRTLLTTPRAFYRAQMEFARKLGDVAERLFHLDVDRRKEALEKELGRINDDDTMTGGDPIGRATDGLSTVVRIPSKEGHVFRSKERTPVLLLMEVLRHPPVDELDVDVDVDVDLEEEKGPDEPSDHPILESVMEEDMEECNINARLERQDSFQNSCDSIPTFDRTSNVPMHKSGVGALQRLDQNSLERESARARRNSTEEEVEEMVVTALAQKNHLTIHLQQQSQPQTKQQQQQSQQHNESEETKTKDSKNVNNQTNKEDNPQPKSSSSSESMTRPCSSPDLRLNKKHTRTHKGKKTPSLSPVNSSSDLRSVGRKIPNKTDRGTGTGTSTASTTTLRGLSNLRPNSLSATGDGRREVLTTILDWGMRGNVVARGATKAVQRTVQAMDRERAVRLLMDGANGDDDDNKETNNNSTNSNNNDDTDVVLVVGEDGVIDEDDLTFGRSVQTTVDSSIHTTHDSSSISTSDEDREAVEALRLLLIQNRVAQERQPQRHTQPSSPFMTMLDDTNTDNNNNVDNPLGEGVADAGEVDSRLSGCGPVSPAIVNAVKLWKDGIVSNREVLDLVKKDLQFLRHTSCPDLDLQQKSQEDSAFWVRFAFGERWAEKRARIASTSPDGGRDGWDLTGVIAKSNDDLRQESFVMQLIELCQEAFENADLELWVKPYRIVATGRTTGIIETVRNAISLDGLKKRPGYDGTGGLRGHLVRMTEFDPNPAEAFRCAQRNFVRSLASYSLISYLFMIKDRHNGNLLLDTAGHVIHIDFGFVFGIAPGGSFSLEMSTPFKLTEEMLEAMDGPGSPTFSEFVTLFCCGFLALQPHADTFCTVVEISARNSTFKCFEGKDSDALVHKLRERFVPQLDKASSVAYALGLIHQSVSSYGTKQYDLFQYYSQGIAT